MNTSAETLQAALAPLAPGHVRPVTVADTVAGVAPCVVVEPADEHAVAATLAYATQERLKVVIRGGGTQLALGFPPSGADILLSTTRLNRLIEYVPHDQTITVQAGMRLRSLQALLGMERQWLALDPVAGEAATIGGLIATNASGARRLRFGGVRDQILGVQVALADGTLAKGGGKVVKNVAGYDLPKLFTGSLGTLGVIVAASFRLYPLPRASRTLLLTAPAIPPLCDLVARTLASALVPTILDLFSPIRADEGYTLAVRFESSVAAACVDQIATLRALVGAGQAAQELADAPEAQFWTHAAQRLDLAADAERLLLKASMVPSEVAGWLERLQQEAAQRDLTVRWRAHAGHGAVYARLAGAEDALIASALTLREEALARGGSLVVQDAPPHVALHLDVWGPIAAFPVMQALKARFDPHATLNPGRFVGGL